MKKPFEEVVRAARIACRPILVRHGQLRPVTEEDIEFYQINDDGTETKLDKSDPLLYDVDKSPSGFVQVFDYRSGEKCDEEIDRQLRIILADAGWTYDEYYNMIDNYFMDFSSDNPEEWIIRYEPKNINKPKIICKD